MSAEFENWSLKPALQGVQCPLLVIHGDNDEYGSSAFPESIAENSGGSASMLIIGGCGHMPHREKPEEVIGAAVEFLSDIG
jgi:pimeloyl-ACP methyl ester carboxylesterase